MQELDMDQSGVTGWEWAICQHKYISCMRYFYIILPTK